MTIAQPVHTLATDQSPATWDRHAIRAAIDTSDIKLRRWQRSALIQQTEPTCVDAGLVTAIMGAGKSVFLALLCAAWRGPVVVSTSTIKLVEQLSDTIAEVTGEPVGRYYTGAKTTERITVVCLPSVGKLTQVMGLQRGLLYIADEAHRCERDMVREFLEVCKPVRRLGLSATPYRADDGLSLWTHEAFRYGYDQAVADGVLVPFRILTPNVRDWPPDSDGRIDLNEYVIAMAKTMDGPGVISAETIDDAIEFAAECMDSGYPVAPVHSRMSRKQVKAAIEQLRGGEVRALVHCHMLSEGVDFPWLRWIALRKARGSRVEFAQEIGRGLRAYPGKAECVIIDPHGVTSTHAIQGLADLEGPDDNATSAEDMEPPPPMVDPLTGELIEWDDLPPKERKRIWVRGDVRVYVMTGSIALRAAGLVSAPTFASPTGKWRSNPASDRSLQFLQKFSKTANFAIQRRGVLDGMDDDATVSHVRATALCLRILCESAGRGDTLTAGIVADAITLGKLVLWGFGDPGADKFEVRTLATDALQRHNVDPLPLLP